VDGTNYGHRRHKEEALLVNIKRTAAIGVLVLLLVGMLGNAAVAQKKLKIAFIPQLIGIPYFNAMEQGGKDAAKQFGVEFSYVGATTASAPEQVRIMDSLIRQEYDGICVSVLDAVSINPVIRKAKDAGIAVYTSDSDSPDSDRAVYVAQALDDELGYTLIDVLVEQIGGEGKIGIVSGVPTATNLNTWVNYMKERVVKYPKVSIVDVRYASSSEEAFRQAQQLMTRYPDIKGLVAVASVTVPGVARAVESANKIGKVKVIGYGSPNTVRSFMKKGIMEASILWNPRDLGYLTVWAGMKLAQGEQFKNINRVPGLESDIRYLPDKGILLLGPPLIITKDNVDDFDF
jgi:ABC-type sugar transport system substrate-binding protein